MSRNVTDNNMPDASMNIIIQLYLSFLSLYFGG